jgi:alkylhydroperoxidase family enzyme
VSAHTLYAGKAGLSQDEILAARRATASDEKSDAALKLARAIALQRGQISDPTLQAARGAGLSDAEIVEIIAHVALSVLTNYTNNIARTVLDFPAADSIEARTAAAETSAAA